MLAEGVGSEVFVRKVRRAKQAGSDQTRPVWSVNRDHHSWAGVVKLKADPTRPKESACCCAEAALRTG